MYTRIVTLLSLALIVLIQLVWLYHSYQFVKSDISTQSTQLLEQAVIEEAFCRSQHTSSGIQEPEQQQVASDPKELPTSPLPPREEESLRPQPAVDAIHSIFRRLLSSKGFPHEVALAVHKGARKVESRGRSDSTVLDIDTHPVNLTEENQASTIQAKLVKPYKVYFHKMGGLLLLTMFLTLVAAGCIISQIVTIIRLKRKARTREDFSYAMVHDMKTPISAISMTLDLLHNKAVDDTPDKRVKFYEIAKGEVSRLLDLTNKVLTLSKIEGEQVKMAKDQIAISPLLNKLTATFSASAHKEVRFTFNLRATHVYADPEYLKEAICNLIDNAVKYSGKRVHISISTEHCGPYTLIKVHDNGWGISPEEQKRVFDKFKRGTKAEQSHRTGFGLGLNFVKQVAKAHKGKITVRSLKGKFTEFTLHLPIQQPVTSFNYI